MEYKWRRYPKEKERQTNSVYIRARIKVKSGRKLENKGEKEAK